MIIKVLLKQVITPTKKRSRVIGNAARVQSPVAGQGLNPAVADAAILSNWIYLDEVNAEQKSAGLTKKTPLFTDFYLRMLATTVLSIRMIRNMDWTPVQLFPVGFLSRCPE
jgi:2-polyprenyl-6-methoxyphenol hydroxylase-like FAD-dependent oxidoreductase